MVFVRSLGAAEGVEWGLWLALTIWWVVELGLGPIELVGMGIVLELSVLLGETPTGVVADLVSRKRSIVIALTVMGLGFVWAVASTNYWVILPAQAVFGVGWTFRSGADTAWVTDELRGLDRHHEVEGLLLRRHRFGIATGLASIVVTVIVGELTSVRWAAVMAGVLHLALALYCAVVMREDNFVAGREEQRGFVAILREGLRVVRDRPRLRILVGVVFILDMGAEAFDRLGFKHFLDSAALEDDSLRALGLLFFVLALAGLAVNALSTRALLAGMGIARLAIVLLVVAAVGGLLASLTSIVVVIGVGYLLQDSVRESLWPVLDGWANRDAPSEVRATVHSLMGQTSAVGELTGGLILGVLAEISSIPVSLGVAGGFFAISAMLARRGVETPAPA